MTRIAVTQGAMDITIEMTATDCAQCLIAFCVPGRYLKERREDKRTFYCPNGHPMSYHQSKADELAAKLKEAERDREWYRTAEREQRDRAVVAERQNTARKGVITKLKKRVVAGACPFGCQRHFANLERHVASKHAGAELPGEADIT